MRIKLVGLIILVSAIVVVGTVKIFSESHQSLAELDNAQDKGTINWYAKRAKAMGEKEITIPAPVVDYAVNFKDIDQAFNYYDVFIVKLVDKYSYAEERRINTWYKFKIIEKLYSKKTSEISLQSSSNDIPTEMLPLGEDEIVMLKTGGSIMQSDIKVKMVDAQFPEFKKSQEYLLFLEMDASGKIGKLRVGPGAVFKVNADGSLIPINNNPHSLKSHVQTMYNNNVFEFKKDVKQRPNTQ